VKECECRLESGVAAAVSGGRGVVGEVSWARYGVDWQRVVQAASSRGTDSQQRNTPLFTRAVR
jgi:hypothetical protein